jgi:hypothetical protein
LINKISRKTQKTIILIKTIDSIIWELTQFCFPGWSTLITIVYTNKFYYRKLSYLIKICASN